MARYKMMVLLLGLLATTSFAGSDETSLRFGRMAYNKPGLFLYNLVQKNAVGRIVSCDTIGLFCSSLRMPYMDSQCRMTWYLLEEDEIQRYKLKDVNNSYTGIGQDDSSLFIHPPRDGRFQVLQFCPYPYFYSNKSSWHWDFKIGSHWGIDSLYPIKEADTFRIDYQLAGEKSLINTVSGPIQCCYVAAKSTSRFGVARSNFYLDNDKGIVSFEMIPVDGTKYEFSLIQYVNSLDTIHFSKDVIRLYRNNAFPEIILKRVNFLY